MTMDLEQARKKLLHEKRILDEKAALMPRIVAGLKSVAHHAKITARVKDAVQKAVGEKFWVTLTSDYLRVYSSVQGENLIPYGDCISLYLGFSDTISIAKLIENAENLCDKFSSAEIEKTLANLDKTAALYELLKTLKGEIDRELPSLHFLRGMDVFDDLYKVHCVYVSGMN